MQNLPLLVGDFFIARTTELLNPGK